MNDDVRTRLFSRDGSGVDVVRTYRSHHPLWPVMAIIPSTAWEKQQVLN